MNVAQRYDIHPERFAGEMPQKYTKDANSFIERNTAKCILCGLCVRSCREVEELSVLGLLGRGFKTSVTPAFALALDQTKCTNCGLCVSLCPTGALTEKSNLKSKYLLQKNIRLSHLILTEISVIILYPVMTVKFFVQFLIMKTQESAN